MDKRLLSDGELGRIRKEFHNWYSPDEDEMKLLSHIEALTEQWELAIKSILIQLVECLSEHEADHFLANESYAKGRESGLRFALGVIEKMLTPNGATPTRGE